MILLKYLLLVEPDRQRLSRFVLSSVTELGGNIFTAALRLDQCMLELYTMLKSNVEPVAIQLVLASKSLQIIAGANTYSICDLTIYPPPEQITNLATRLSQESEMADPELLCQRNAKISEDLEKAKALATAEMSQLEAQLEVRRVELMQAQKDAETDALTQLFNRGAYDTRLEKAMARCQRQNEPLCLLMLDVDKFKEINDTNGHQHGDKYLQKVAQSLESSCRKEVDHCCRIGGDEFAAILYTTLPITERIANNILEKMGHKVSMGIAQMVANEKPKDLAKRCDSALYEAKENGRGQYAISNTSQPKQDERAN